ncbi:hypothetical protein RG47T_2886 [Mucilaginibacter polytrichastri]|uniref:Uncharacterized protein n=1 Tax=Mucilaginibacter polytrichastri TaxID=1302689 RepID=A0A1Q6A079_9SPHI|nr:hypothetical protein RG47T_2886 [Mucilaginibacter polytrichastri]
MVIKANTVFIKGFLLIIEIKFYECAYFTYQILIWSNQNLP